MTKRSTRSFYSLSTKFLNRYYKSGGWGSMLVNGKPVCSLIVNDNAVKIGYTLTDRNGVRTEVDQQVFFTWTDCHYGGRRRWFLCPRCAQRVGVLYMGKMVACRRCWDLRYPCQQDRDERGWSMYHRLLDKAGGDGGKPRGMRWETYYRLKDKADRLCMKQLLPLITKWRIK